MNHTATVEVLSAEVRVLQVGARQVTLSVFRQLDTVGFDAIIPFGRVRDPRDDGSYDSRVMNVIGRDIETGSLVRCHLFAPSHERLAKYPVDLREKYVRVHEQADAWEKLPLIVLAGLT